MKRVLDFGHTTSRTLLPFYPNPDIVENGASGKYDIIICERETFQNNIEEMLVYTHKDTKILIDIISESGNLDNFIDIFLELTFKYDTVNFYLLVDSIFDIKAGNNVKMLQSYKLSFLPFFENYCLQSHDSQFILNDVSIYKKTNGILSLNGSMRTQRIILLLELLKNNYINKNCEIINPDNVLSFLFYGSSKFNVNDYENFINGLLDNQIITNEEYSLLIEIKTKLPIVARGEEGNRPELILKEFYSNILNLVTENTAGYDDSDNSKYGTITLTEKAWKPFMTHQLPLYIGLKDYVSVIRSLGFDIFDDFIDHSYNLEKDHKKRIELVIKELNRISKMDMLSFYEKNKQRFVKNCVNIFKLKSESFLELEKFITENDLI